MLAALLTLGCIALTAGALLGWGNKRYPRGDNPLEMQIDALLPQTQCAQCGYPGCRPYARAIARGEAGIDLCPPGGEETALKLAKLLGQEKPALARSSHPDLTARVDEAECIGCALCLKACPVDAILGAARHMHTVIEDVCTGCELCIEPCPVDCIEMVEKPVPLDLWRWPAPNASA